MYQEWNKNGFYLFVPALDLPICASTYFEPALNFLSSIHGPRRSTRFQKGLGSRDQVEHERGRVLEERDAKVQYRELSAVERIDS